jgi:hypothetical protein
LRLVTLQQSLRKITRAVRAMIEETGMHVVFSTIGENTEIKKETAEEIVLFNYHKRHIFHFFIGCIPLLASKAFSSSSDSCPFVRWA